MRRLSVLAIIATCSGAMIACGRPHVGKISHGWSYNDRDCTSTLFLLVETEPGAAVEVAGQRAVATAEVANFNSAFLTPGATAAAEFRLPWGALTPGATKLDIIVSRDGRKRHLSHTMKREPRIMHFWGGHDRQLPTATVKLFGQQTSDKESLATGSLIGDTVVFEVQVCHVGSATATEGQVETSRDLLRLRLPLSRLVTMELPESPPKPREIWLALTGTDGGTGKLFFSVDPASLLERLFAKSPATPILPEAPPYKPHAPKILLGNARVELIPAQTPIGEVAAVATMVTEDVQLPGCLYTNPSAMRIVQQTRTDVVARVREARSGRLIASKRFQGSYPAPCPSGVTDGEMGRIPTGGDPASFEPAYAWLKAY